MKNEPVYDQGMYLPKLESDACGIGLIADLNGKSSHETVDDALTILECMAHRGASGCEPDSGDGAGLLCNIADDLFREEFATNGVELPDYQSYGVGVFFLPIDPILQNHCLNAAKEISELNNFECLGIRDVPTDNTELGQTAQSTEPKMVQFFVKSKSEESYIELDRKLYFLRKSISRAIKVMYPIAAEDFYIASFSCRTMIYKGQLTSHQVRGYFLDLQNPLFKSKIALVHSRFSTNTTPKWRLAQPFRCIAHNGEINTIQGNIQWWQTRETDMISGYYSNEELSSILPICIDTRSDSANFDGVLEFLSFNGRTMPHALMMMIPEAWQNNPAIPDYKKDFYEYHEQLIEPWDGPASMCFTDGTLVGATLDRNGLRPSRYLLTKNNRLVLGSEAGCLSTIPPEDIVYKGRLQPGKILIADLDEHRIIGDKELKEIICQRAPYGEWLDTNRLKIDDLPLPNITNETDTVALLQRQIAAGYTKEDEEMILKAIDATTKEPIGSMGSDIPLAVLSQIAQHPANYFKQQFAQVTNPSIDPLREQFFMSLHTFLGGSGQIIESGPNEAKALRLNSPILNKENYEKLKYSQLKAFKSAIVNATFERSEDENALISAITVICRHAETLVRNGVSLLFIDDQDVSANRVQIPSLLASGAIHQHLIKKGLRRKVSLITVGADIIETHHAALLFSFGADAIYPYLAIKSIQKISKHSANKAAEVYIKALSKGLLKIMSKLGVSTIQSYKGAQTFEVLGLSNEVIDICFTGAISRIGGLSFSHLQKELMVKHNAAFITPDISMLTDVGAYQWKQKGEYHLFNPKTIHLLQHSTQKGDYDIYKKYTDAINQQAQKACTLRSFFEFANQAPIPLSEVEPIETILKRFATGAMSFGSLSHEAHSLLAVAMNRIGGKSNSGEGGEDPSRYIKKPNGDWERSAIKQVASGRFGVTIDYLNQADELQIKIAQGAKPGEGGHLPGHKVNPWIARVRNSTPGVGLVSPPPHHDIYSIEDLAQLIFDLKNANETARISVKLVSKAGVGIIASGVAKGHAEHILISGADGGTGASPLSSIRHAGIPWELGLAETHQTLVRNGLRDRVVLQTDGQIRTGRDLAIASILGAEEWGIATAALVVEGCILMRKCHLNTCPVGIATQDENLRQKFSGKVEHLINFFTFLAKDLREIMASLGVRTVNELVGQTQFLKQKESASHWKAGTVNLSNILFKPENNYEQTLYQSKKQNHELAHVLDKKLIQYAALAINDKVKINSIFPVKNTDRAIGTMLSSNIAKRYGSDGLADGSINFRFRGSAGQSYGAFAAKGLSFILEGEANDYVGKGLSGAELIIVPDRKANYEASKNIIVGNVALYGATSGQVFIKGQAGERFAVRNSGATAVVEGIGANGCEYMTGGIVIVLGEVGKNFAAGMSGGEVYLYAPSQRSLDLLNRETIVLEKPNQEDSAKMRSLIRAHFSKTSSHQALQILTNWTTEKESFIKVMPIEYKKVLALQAKESRKKSLA